MAETCLQCPHKPKARSLPDHKRFFGLINAAFHHWPDGHLFQPQNEDHLRGWLLMKAGYNTVVEVELSDDTAIMRKQIECAAAVVQALPCHGTLRTRPGALEIVMPRSISFKVLSQREFSPIREAVEAVLREETGFEASELLNMHRSAA